MSTYPTLIFRAKETVFAKFPSIAHMYAFNRFGRNEWIAQEAGNVPAGASVLDIGAGDCPYRNLFAHCRYRAHDFKRLQQDDLQDRSGYGAIDIESDITAIPLPTGSVDVILCTEVLEHIPDPIASVREMSRLLCPGGKLILTAPLRSGLHQVPFHFYGGYTPYWYERFLPAFGLDVQSIQPAFGILRSYAEDGLRVLIFFSPIGRLPLALRIAMFPLFLVLIPFLGVLVPLLARLFDALDHDPAFAGGYRVIAVRQQVA